MDSREMAKELVGMARGMVGADFPTQKALDKYLEEHPDADRGKHKVRKTVWDDMTPAQRSKWESEDRADSAEKARKNRFRGSEARTAATTVVERMRNAHRMIGDGGRGIELGIREISYLASDMAELERTLRRMQGGGKWENSAVADMLEVLERHYVPA